MVKPRFIEKGGVIELPQQTFGKEILNPSICSQSTIEKVKHDVQRNRQKWGTAYNIKDKISQLQERQVLVKLIIIK